jgi:hypothetical protein
MKTISLDTFVKETQKDILKFQAAYMKKHKQNPEHYPLELFKDNSGLWFEFFMEYCQNGTV